MSRQLYVTETISSPNVDYSQRSVAESDKQMLGRSIIAQIVGVRSEIEHTGPFKGFRIEELTSPVVAIRDRNRVKIFQKRDSLWFVQATDAAFHLAVPKIHNFQAVVP